MPRQTLLITGCSRGIGRALAQKFAAQNCVVYAVSRTLSSLQSLAESSNYIHPIEADITTVQGRETIYHALDNEPMLSIIHNAGTSNSATFDNLSETSLREAFELNFFAPILLTQHLLIKLKGQRVLNISTGAALQGRAYKLSYCCSKTAMHRAIESLQQEFSSQEIYFANLRPGMVDTPMQAHLRNETVPTRDFYIRAQAEGELISPETVAAFVSWVMLNTSNAEFTETFWNIDEPKYHDRWQTTTMNN